MTANEFRERMRKIGSGWATYSAAELIEMRQQQVESYLRLLCDECLDRKEESEASR